MIRRIAALGLMPLATLVLCQCGGGDPTPVLIGESQEKIAKGDALFRKAQAKEAKGDHGGAIKLYDEVADDYAFSTHAGEARYRQAKLLHQKGKIKDAYEAYDQLLSYYPNHPKRKEVVESIFQIATGAQKGEVQDRGFLFIGGDFSLKQTVEMLTGVRVHAPKSDMAAKAQYAIGEAYLREDKYLASVEAFRKVADFHRGHRLAPEALFRVGKILMEQTEQGNQNQANLDLAREAFNDYLIQFPGHRHNAEARKMIASLGARDVKRTIDIADFYYKTGNMKSAKIYYKEVLKLTKSGKLHDRAKARLAELEN